MGLASVVAVAVAAAEVDNARRMTCPWESFAVIACLVIRAGAAKSMITIDHILDSLVSPRIYQKFRSKLIRLRNFSYQNQVKTQFNDHVIKNQMHA